VSNDCRYESGAMEAYERSLKRLRAIAPRIARAFPANVDALDVRSFFREPVHRGGRQRRLPEQGLRIVRTNLDARKFLISQIRLLAGHQITPRVANAGSAVVGKLIEYMNIRARRSPQASQRTAKKVGHGVRP
jgi:hypothetical protein